MMKNKFKIHFVTQRDILCRTVLIFFTLVFSSCMDDDSFTYELSEQADLVTATISIESSSLSQCSADIFITVSNKATIYYLALPADIEAPNSEDVFEMGSALQFSESGTLELNVSNLAESTDYRFYAISVNTDGLRSEEVFVGNYSQPSYEIMVDTSYTATSMALGAETPPYTATLTPTGNSNEYTIDTAWGPELVATLTADPSYTGQFLYSGTLTINSDYTVTIVGDDIYATGGNGVYDPCTHQISYELTQTLFTNNFVTEVNMVPINF